MTVREMAREVTALQKKQYALYAPEVLARCTDAYWQHIEHIFTDACEANLRDGTVTSIEWNGEKVTL